MIKKLSILTILMFVTTSSVFLQSRMLSFVSFIQEKQYTDPEGAVVWFRNNPYSKNFGVDEEVYLFYRGMSRYTSYARYQGNKKELSYSGGDFARVLKYPQESQYFYKDRAFLMIAGILLHQRDDREIPARIFEYFLYVSEPSHPFYPTALYWSCLLGYLDRSIYEVYYNILNQLSDVRGALIYDFNRAEYVEISGMIKKLKVPKKAVLYNYRWTRHDTDLFALIEQMMPQVREDGAILVDDKVVEEYDYSDMELLGKTTVMDGVPTTVPSREYIAPRKSQENKVKDVNPKDFGTPGPNITGNTFDKDMYNNTDTVVRPSSKPKYEGRNIREEMIKSAYSNGPSATEWFENNKYSSEMGVSPYEYSFYRGVAYFGRFVNEGRVSTQFAAQSLSDFKYSSIDRTDMDRTVKSEIYLAAIELFAYGDVEEADRGFRGALGMVDENNNNYPTIIYWRLRLHLASKSESDMYKQYLRGLSQGTKITDYSSNRFEPLSVMIPKAASEGITIKPIERVRPNLSEPK